MDKKFFSSGGGGQCLHPDTAAWCQLSDGLFSKTKDLIKSQHARVNIVNKKDIKSGSRCFSFTRPNFFLPRAGVQESVFREFKIMPNTFVALDTNQMYFKLKTGRFLLNYKEIRKLCPTTIEEPLKLDTLSLSGSLSMSLFGLLQFQKWNLKISGRKERNTVIW